MNIIKWIFFIPIAFIGYYILLYSIGLAYELLPAKEDNIILGNYIVPIIGNAFGIYAYFYIGNKIIATTKFSNKDTEARISNILLLSFIIIASGVFAYFSFKYGEFYKGIVNSINVFVSIICFQHFFRIIKNPEY